MYYVSCDICTFVQAAEREIFSTEYWLVALSKDQSTLGRAYVSLKDHKASLSVLTPEQWGDYIEVVEKVEQTWRAAFNAEPFNWACMMNYAYRNAPPNPHVHWHVRPRYARPVVFDGETYTDVAFASHYDPTYRHELSENQLTTIIRKLRKHLQ